mmetsp:Transcript_2240/g.2334  ORF Transcript_2240/g.2334 Transcript_2240/m.2334 type:complete len:422 (-) Transcript_2240:142-1407(-)|eukprot:CAMPEP_0182416348 /NCGR_PEP_ID=MMETSP1167-20130531/615_1 /TAXON_ID=2988 /ORGANISM="Mallomonas Sp, Strain CCMP3275" /LENGTH=421 /DNA_ID=CAMNT_0024589021 /DNA_START=83 /DNA_END=1348 /DNA_ORIENTATION=-
MSSVEIEVEKENHGEENAKCSTAGMVVFILGLIGGTFSAIFCKMSFESSSEGISGETKQFSKPISVLFIMFCGMIPAYFMWLIQQKFRQPHERETLSLRIMMLLIVPCICDLLCTLLLLVAQLFITASMWQMLRGTVICITALLKSTVLKHKLRTHMWAGVAIITAAMILVASSTFLAKPDPNAPEARDPRVGVVLVLLGCLAQGVQYVFEEKVMAVDDVPPLVVIGFEGIWGALLTLVLVYPLAYLVPGSDAGSYENPYDSFLMIYNSPWLQSILVIFVLTVTVYNCMAVYVTRYLSSIWHAILDNFRPITVWGMDLAIFYLILPGSAYGENWNEGSYLQLGGLLVLFLGTAVYNGSVMICDGGYVAIADKGKDEHMIRTEPAMASPSLTRSPMVYRGGHPKTIPSPLVTRPVRRQVQEA